MSDDTPDHWAAAAEALEALARQLRTRLKSPEDIGPEVILLGRIMRRAT